MVRREGTTLWDGLREVQHIVGNSPVVGHHVMFDLAFTRRQRVFQVNLPIDTFELANLLVPWAGEYSLTGLAKELGIEFNTTRRALKDTLTAKQLYLKVFERVSNLPNDVLEEITAHARRSGWVLDDFWQSVLEELARGVFTTTVAALKKVAGLSRTT